MSLIQDALKKVQKERDKIQNTSIDEHKDSNNNSNSNIIVSKKKRYILLGSILLIITIISITATFLFKKPVKRNKIFNKNIIRKNRIVNKKQNKIKQGRIEKKQNKTENNFIKKARSVRNLKNSSTQLDSRIPIKRPTLLNPYNRRIIKNKKKKTVLKSNKKKKSNQKITLLSKKKLRRKKKRISKFEAIVKKGDDLYKNKRYIDAVQYYIKALKKKKSRKLYINIYKCYKKSKNMVLLKAYAFDALKHFKDDVFFSRVIGILLFREKKYLTAYPYFEIILKEMRNDIDALIYKGLCLFHLKRFEESLSIFREIVKLDNKKLEPYYYIGLIYDNLKDYKSALYYYRIFEQNKGINNNFRHKNWIRNRISLIKRRIEN